jgi:hypothetical protein
MKMLRAMGVEMNRIQMHHSLIDAIQLMSESDVGSALVLTSMIKYHDYIDPDAVLGPMQHVGTLDDFGIYGEDIWILYCDVCKGDLVDLIGMLRAVQLEFLSLEALKKVIRNMEITPAASIALMEVRQALPAFGVRFREVDAKGGINGLPACANSLN